MPYARRWGAKAIWLASAVVCGAMSVPMEAAASTRSMIDASADALVLPVRPPEAGAAPVNPRVGVQDEASAQARVSVPEATPQALRYYRSGMVLWALGGIVTLLIPAVILFSGLSGWMWRRIDSAVGRWLLAAVVFTVAYFTLDWVLRLPLSFYRGYVRQHAYGLSNQSFGQWLGDSVKARLFLLVFLAVVVPGLYGFFRAAPKRWWLYASAALAVVTVFVVLIQPIWVAPRFDDFGPMRDKPLEAEILALAHRAGIEAERVFEVDKSEDTEAVNAYVTGVGATRRIVLWDTLVDKLEPAQVRFVMGHEMGHYVLKHVWYFIAFTVGMILVTLYTAHRSMEGLVRRFGDRFGFHRVADVASLPLALLIAFGLGFLVSPVANALSRYQEHEADRFALELTHDNRAGATSFVTLSAVNLANPDPGPIYRLFRATHPAVADRIEFANDYRPWETGQAQRYAHLFADEP